ncbi:kinase-like protein [Rhizodiscina lignyota]|uniref:Kinase-like protein n=1 Tax=Rhizodiscina lignyota TaxID=1504668 RepID=A0A9P4IKS4_9PEZI|nr:kinase-like protein [Rhizodiscina lignyota]
MPSSPFRWPTSSRASSPRPANLYHSVSFADFHSPNTSDWVQKSPPSPTQSDFGSSLSRSATPTNNPWGRSGRLSMSRNSSRERSRFDSPVGADLSNANLQEYSATAAYAKAYWSSLPSSEQPRGRSDSVSTTSTIRDGSTTPPARLPKFTMRNPNVSLIDLAEDTEALSIEPASPVTFDTDLNIHSLPLSPQSSPQSPSERNQSPPERNVKLSLPQPPPPIINQAAVSQMMKALPSIFKSQRDWQPPKRQEVYMWAVCNTKCAMLLLWMCGDIDAGARAHFYNINDTMLPFKQSDLDGIATNASEALQKQWRVMAKELPRSGEHLELTRQHAAPFEQLETLRLDPSGSSRIDRVRWMDFKDIHSDGTIVARKTMATRSQGQKLNVLQSIKGYRRLNSENIAKILVSYSQGPHISIVTQLANQSLADFLRSTSKPDCSMTLSWIHQLTKAIAYIHSSDLHHGAIRPSKILINPSGKQVVFSVFGISASPNAQYTSIKDERFIYAPPERLTPQSRPTKAADVFSLGAVFLDILTVALGISDTTFTAYRAATKANGDASFHANIDRARAWLQQLLKAPMNSPTAVEKRTVRGFAEVLGQMMVLEPAARIRTRKLELEIARWEDERVRVSAWERTSEGWRSTGA